MSLIRWQRPRSVMSLFDDMDRMFRDMARMPWANLEGGAPEWGPAVDVYDTDTEVIVKASLAGACKEDIEVNANDEGLTIHGETRPEETVQEEGYYRRELRYGVFHRTIPWPARVDPDSVTAKFEDGMLTLRATKTEQPTGGKKIDVR